MNVYALCHTYQYFKERVNEENSLHLEKLILFIDFRNIEKHSRVSQILFLEKLSISVTALQLKRY